MYFLELIKQFLPLKISIPYYFQLLSSRFSKSFVCHQKSSCAKCNRYCCLRHGDVAEHRHCCHLQLTQSSGSVFRFLDAPPWRQRTCGPLQRMITPWYQLTIHPLQYIIWMHVLLLTLKEILTQ